MMSGIRSRLARLEETILPHPIQHICLVGNAENKPADAAQEEARMEYLAKHGREPDGYILLMPMKGRA